MAVPSHPLREARFQVRFSDHIGESARTSILDEMAMDLGTERTPQTDGSFILLVRKANKVTWVTEDLNRREIKGVLRWSRLE